MYQYELNQSRAQWGKAALAGHLAGKNETLIVHPAMVEDAIVDLLHFADSQKYDSCHIGGTALGKFLWEKDNPNIIID